jgi:hypothetical protein
MTLDQYFHLIVNKQQKETTMFEKTKMFFNEQIERCAEKINSLLTKPTTFEDNSVLEGYDDGYWAFEMYTPEWINEHGETKKPVHTVLVEPHEGTWMGVLDNVLDAMEAHYGYNIKEQVYYSVNFPLNDTDDRGNPFPGYGRCLNDERLQQILLAFPELYLSGSWGDNPEKSVFK